MNIIKCRCISNRIFSPLILLVQMLLTTFYFILCTFINGEEGNVSSKNHSFFNHYLLLWLYQGVCMLFCLISNWKRILATVELGCLAEILVNSSFQLGLAKCVLTCQEYRTYSKILSTSTDFQFL